MICRTSIPRNHSGEKKWHKRANYAQNNEPHYSQIPCNILLQVRRTDFFYSCSHPLQGGLCLCIPPNWLSGRSAKASVFLTSQAVSIHIFQESTDGLRSAFTSLKTLTSILPYPCAVWPRVHRLLCGSSLPSLQWLKSLRIKFCLFLTWHRLPAWPPLFLALPARCGPQPWRFLSTASSPAPDTGHTCLHVCQWPVEGSTAFLYFQLIWPMIFHCSKY